MRSPVGGADPAGRPARPTPLQAPGSTYAGCGLPMSLANFQGYFPCSPEVGGAC